MDNPETLTMVWIESTGEPGERSKRLCPHCAADKTRIEGYPALPGDQCEQCGRTFLSPWLAEPWSEPTACPYEATDRDECCGMRERSVAGISDFIPDCPQHGKYPDAVCPCRFAAPRTVYTHNPDCPDAEQQPS